MTGKAALCTQSDITRLIKASLAAGIPANRITGVKLTKDGATILYGEPEAPHIEPKVNMWDEVLFNGKPPPPSIRQRIQRPPRKNAGSI